jgi:hypothetical protein
VIDLCPGIGTKTKGHRHSNNCKTITMISRRKQFDADAFAKVLVALVNAKRQAEELGRPFDVVKEPPLPPRPERQGTHRFLAPRPTRSFTPRFSSARRTHS